MGFVGQVEMLKTAVKEPLPSMHIVRQANLDDAKRLSFLAEQTFRDTFLRI